MLQPPAQPPGEHRSDDDHTRTKRDDRVNDRRTRANHPDDDRLTEADLDRREAERRSTHSHAMPSR
jgi:hypothetical protein